MKFFGEIRQNMLAQNHKFFQEFEFENHMDNQAWGITNYLIKLERLETIIKRILHLKAPKKPSQS